MSKTLAELHKEIDEHASLEFSGFMHQITVDDVLLMFREEKQAIISNGTFNLEDDMDKRVLQVARIMFNKLSNEEKFHYQKVARQMKSQDSELGNEAPVETIAVEKTNWKEVERYNQMKGSKGVICTCDAGNENATFSTAELYTEHMEQHSMDVLYGCHNCNHCFLSVEAHNNHTCGGRRNAMKTKYPADREFKIAIMMLVCRDCGFSMNLHPSVTGEQAVQQMEVIRSLYLSHSCAHLGLIKILTTDSVLRADHKWKVDFILPSNFFQSTKRKCCGMKYKSDDKFKKHIYEHLSEKEKLAAFLQAIHLVSTKNIMRREEKHDLGDENDVIRNDKFHSRIAEKFPTRSTQLVVTLDDDDELENYEVVDLASSVVAIQSSSDDYKVTAEFSSFRETVEPVVSALFERVLLCTKCRYACVGDDAALSHYRGCYPEVDEIPKGIVEDSKIFEVLVEDNSLPNVRVQCKIPSCTTKCCSLDGYKAHMVIAHSMKKVQIVGDVSRFSTMVWPFFDWKTRISMDINEMCGLTRDGTLPCPISDTYRPGSQYKPGSFAREKPRRKRRGNRYRHSPDGMIEDDTPDLTSSVVSANSSITQDNEQMQEGAIVDGLDKEPHQIPEELERESAVPLEQQDLHSPRTRSTEDDEENVNTTHGEPPVDFAAEAERQAMTVAQLWDEGRKSRDTPPEESGNRIHFGNFCFHCGFQLQSEEAFLKHIEAHDISHVCRLCEEEYAFPDTESYMTHLCYHHGRTAENDGENAVQCSFCERFFSQYLLVAHLIFDCYNSPRCGICGENMHGMRSNQRKSHAKKHREFWKRFQCSCQETFPNYQLYRNHVCSSQSRTLVIDMEPQLFLGVVVDRTTDPILFQTCQKLPTNAARTDRSDMSLENSAASFVRTQTIPNDIVTNAVITVEEARADGRLQEKEATPNAFEGSTISNDMTETTGEPSCSSFNARVAEDVCPPSVIVDTCPPSVMIISSTNVSPSHSTHDDAFCQPSTSSKDENFSNSDAIPPSTVTIRPDDNEIEFLAEGPQQSGADRHNNSDIIFEEPSRTGNVVAWGVEDDEIQVAEAPSGTTAANSGREKGHKCKFCSHAFYTKRNLDAHEKEKHSSDIRRFGETCENNDYGIPKNGSLYLCVLCSYVFDSQERFDTHHRNHKLANNPILQCEYCCGIQLSQENMNQHRKYHGYEIGTQRQVKAPTLRYICADCDPHCIFVEESGLLLHLMLNHGKEILFYCKGCFYASCNIELVKAHIFGGCRPNSPFQSGWGFALANQIEFQPLNKDLHVQNLSSRPGDFVVMSNCSHRTFIRFGLKFTSCPEEKSCHGIVNYSRYENLLKARLNFFEDEIPEHMLPKSVYIRPNYTLENWINFMRGPITNEDKSPTEWPWPYNLPQPTRPVQPRIQPQQANMLPPQQHSVAGQPSAVFRSTPVHRGVFPQQIPAGHVQGRMFTTQNPSSGQLPVFTHPAHPYSMTGQGMQRQPMMASAAMMPGAPVVMQPIRQPQRHHLVSCVICDTVMLSSFILHLPQEQREREKIIVKVCSALPVNHKEGIKMKMSYPDACICWRHVNPYGIIRQQPGERMTVNADDVILDYVQFARKYDVLANADRFLRTLNELMTNACNEYFNPNEAVEMLRRTNTCNYSPCVSKPLTSNMKVHLHRAHSSQNFHIMCEMCNAFFDTVPALFGHIYSQHFRGALRGQLLFSLKCPLCNSEPFTDPRRFRFHIKNDHKGIFQQLTINCDTHFATEEARDRHDRKHRKPSACCFICGMADPPKFTPPGAIVHLPHEAIHSLIPTYLCRICLNEFQSQRDIVKHFAEGHRLQGPWESQTITRYKLGYPSNIGIVVVVNVEELCHHLGIQR